MGRILQVIGATALLAVLPAVSVDARRADGPRRLGPPWATVNVCDTGGHPDGVGVRGWMPPMPGLGPGEALQMRFRLQYRSGLRWLPVRRADSGWLTAGTGARRPAEAGQTFTVTPPRAGRAYVLRGVVGFRWRTPGGIVVRTARRLTRPGHPRTAGADPEGYSAATCTVR